jgi:hypothetical protein
MEYDKKEIARKLLDDVGGTPRVYAFKDESGKEIDIFCGDDSPIEHVSSYSTVGLSEYTLNKKIDDKSLRAEIRLYTKSGAWKNSSPGFQFLYTKRQIPNIIKV